MRFMATLVILMACVSCGVAPQPDSIRTVAAYEIPLPAKGERDELIRLLHRLAESDGLHVDAATDEELRQTAEAIPEAKMTVHAAVWRGAGDEHSEAVIMDQADHLGQVWIMFSKGEDPLLAKRFRDKAVKEIFARWPATLALPIMPTGAIPLRRDLVRTENGYEVAHSAAARYTVEGDH